MTKPTQPIPVSILTGFLGAGKTTLLNYILKQQHGYKFAIIVNEIGADRHRWPVGRERKEEIVQMNNGCVCCTVRKDLVKGVQELVKRGGFDYLLVETTGIADPGPVAQTFLNIPQITAVSPARLPHHRGRRRADPAADDDTETAKEQIVMADFLVLNKTDLVDEVQAARSRSARLPPSIPHADDLPDEPFPGEPEGAARHERLRVDRKLAIDPQFLDELKHRHHDAIASWPSSSISPIHIDRFEAFVHELTKRDKVFRSKGFLSLAGNPRRAVFHGVNNRFTIFWDRLWEKSEERKSQLVFIGENLDEPSIRAALEKCLA